MIVERTLPLSPLEATLRPSPLVGTLHFQRFFRRSIFRSRRCSKTSNPRATVILILPSGTRSSTIPATTISSSRRIMREDFLVITKVRITSTSTISVRTASPSTKKVQFQDRLSTRRIGPPAKAIEAVALVSG